MRARYSAFALHKIDFIMASQKLGSAVAIDEYQQTKAFAKNSKFISLTVKKAKNKSADNAEVEFIALFTQFGKLTQLHETSEFIKREDCWYYTGGEADFKTLTNV